MIRTLTIAVAACLAAVAPAHAKVTASHAGGFTSAHEITIPLSASAAYDLFLQPSKWWSGEHTYSGDAANLKVARQASGCWCERLPGGGFVQHLTLSYAAPGQGLRFLGGLGPLQQMAANGALSVAFSAASDGRTTVKVSYVVTGLKAESVDGIGKAVDGVLAEQIGRYEQFALAQAKPR
jgi:hypothetical protein